MSAASEAIVVGAGIAGLCAARRLADAGRRVTLFEARAEIGGAARPGWLVSTADRALGEFLDAATLRDDALAAARAFHLGAAAALQPAPGEGALPRELRAVRWRLPRLERLVDAMRTDLSLGAPERAARYDDRSIEEFGRLYLGRRAVAGWLEPWLATRAPVDPARTSRVAALLALAHRRTAPVAALRRAPALLDFRWTRGITVHCSARVDAVELKSRSELAVRSGGQRHPADALVLAVPIAETIALGETLWTRAQRRALESLRHRETSTWRCPVTDPGPLARIQSPGSRISTLSSLRVSRARSARVASLCFDHGAGELSARLRANGVEPPSVLAGHIEELLPGLFVDFEAATLETRLRPHFDVGAYRAVRVARRVTAEVPALFLAGEAWSEATLEGAAQSGRRAADEVLAALARAPRPADSPRPASP